MKHAYEQKRIIAVLEAVEAGFDNSYLVADELGIPVKNASAALSDLRESGLIAVVQSRRFPGARRRVNIYRRAGERVRRRFEGQFLGRRS